MYMQKKADKSILFKIVLGRNIPSVHKKFATKNDFLDRWEVKNWQIRDKNCLVLLQIPFFVQSIKRKRVNFLDWI